MIHLEKATDRNYLKSLSYKELEVLSDEIRNTIIETVSKNGGHLASNLGTVELTLALHRVFDVPEDSIVFDVGHQCYTHKLLDERQKNFCNIRKNGGISGFTKISESENDAFGAGHSGTSVSAALGIATANKLDRNGRYAVAIVGDGSLSNGMIYEALNNCTDKKLRLIIIINDNEMSISKNVGAMSKYLSEVTSSKTYIKIKSRLFTFCLKTGGFGAILLAVARAIKNFIKRIFVSKNFFECLGFKYYGQINGHDEQLLELVLKEAKKKEYPSVIHVITKKGKGYLPAEEHPEAYHSVSPFDVSKGVSANQNENFSNRFGKKLCELAEKNKNICAITAAMTDGTGLSDFPKQFPDRFFDVGIAEEHAITFCAGLASKGKLPVFAVYSSFLQRCFDQLLHDVSIQNFKIILGIDRAGLVSGDGITHQGIYDVSLLKLLPGFEIYSPETYSETDHCLEQAEKSKYSVAIRYPKGKQKEAPSPVVFGNYYTENFGTGEKTVVLFTYGRISSAVYECAKTLGENHKVRFVKLLKIHPIEKELLSFAAENSYSFFIEESYFSGSIAEEFGSLLEKSDIKTHYSICALEAKNCMLGNEEQLLEDQSFTKEKLFDRISSKIK